MAYRKSSAIGDLHGRVENLIFRTRNGKNVAYARPLNQNISNSKKSSNTRRNFAVANSLASSLNSVPELKDVWSAAKVPGSNSYQKLVSMNTKLAAEGRLTTSNVITPQGQFIKLNSSSVENNIIHLSFLCPSCTELTFPAHLFIYMYFVKSGGKIVPLMVEVTDAQPDGNYDLEIVADKTVSDLLAEDPSPLIYIALLGGTVHRKKVYWTSTTSVQL